jgi:AsmA family protein
MSRPLRVALIVIGTVVILAGGAMVVLESGIPRRIAESVATGKLGRPVSMSHLEIDLLPRPRIEVRELKIANIEGGSTTNMVELARGEAILDGSRLLIGRIDVLSAAAERPVIVLEKNKDGQGNWQFGDPDKPATETAPDFPVRKLVIQEGRVIYRDPTEQVDIGVDVNSQPAGDNGVERLALAGDGRIAGSDFKLKGAADTVLNLQNTDRPYALEAEISVGDNRARLAGSLREPLRFEGLAADLHVEAKNAYDLYQLTGIAIPPTPPYVLDGKLYREKDVWRLEPFTAKVGESDLRGTATFDVGGERPKLVADLTSRKLAFPDFGGFIGADVPGVKDSGIQQVQRKSEQKQARGQPTRAPPKSDSSGVIPDTEIDFERLKAMDAHVKFRGTRVESPIVPVNEVATELTLENGLAQVKPLRFGIGQGKVDITLTLDGRRKPASLNAVMAVNRVPAGEILRSVERKLEQYQTSTGTLGGRAEIKGQGNSLKALLASSNGHLGLAMEEGQIGLLLLELIGLDAAESLGVLLTGNKPIPLRCFIADFEFIDGIMGSRTFLIDTADTNIVGEGAVNFKTERIDFRLVPYPKDVSLFSARSPIVIGGPLNDIKVRPEAAPLAARVGLAAALSAVLTPLAAPLAFLDAGLGKDSDCAAFVNDVRARIERQKRDSPQSGEPRGAPARR